MPRTLLVCCRGCPQRPPALPARPPLPPRVPSPRALPARHELTFFTAVSSGPESEREREAEFDDGKKETELACVLVLVLAHVKNNETQTVINLAGNHARPRPPPAAAVARNTPTKVLSETNSNGHRQEAAEICLFPSEDA